MLLSQGFYEKNPYLLPAVALIGLRKWEGLGVGVLPGKNGNTLKTRGVFGRMAGY